MAFVATSPTGGWEYDKISQQLIRIRTQSEQFQVVSERTTLGGAVRETYIKCRKSSCVLPEMEHFRW